VGQERVQTNSKMTHLVHALRMQEGDSILRDATEVTRP